MPSKLILGLMLCLVVTAARAETPVERGRYLVEGIMGCGNCHTPQVPGARPLSGNAVVDDNPAFRAIAPNITQDRATGIGAWSDAEITRAIREGIRPNGLLIGPPMPFAFYRQIADDDVAAVVAYLRTVPAVSNVAEPSTYRIPLPSSYGPPVGHVTAPDRGDKLRYGAYLAGPLGHCLECHSPLTPQGERDLSKAGAGGQPFPGPWGMTVAANITSSKTSGLGAWSDAEIEHAIRDGVARDGRKLTPPMGFAYYKTISADDMGALIAFLRTLPAVEK